MGQETLESKVHKFQEYLDELGPYMVLEDKEILDNKEKLFTVERIFQLLVDEAIDINSNILYSNKRKVSDSYKSSFYDLASINIMDYSFADRISGSAGLRNNIVHDYEKMQKKDVVRDIKKFFELYKEYIKLLVNKFVIKK